MSDTIIKVENLGKKYILGHQSQGSSNYVALRDVIAEGAKSLVKSFSCGKSNLKANQEEFWALKDVSFEVKRGECIGIIGRNGAGKSTLLKILSRITEPTTGRIEINGRVASLLEVGTGFHPELTGRENIYLNGAILGMSRQEIKRKFDEIVAFAEVEKFLDTPVKRYSSGMYVRLAFAVAAHLEPEILVVDEVLAVGDAAFQKKCLGKMGDVTTREGRTVLFVSHNMNVITSLCEKAILLDRGKLQSNSQSNIVIEQYLQLSNLSFGQPIWKNKNDEIRPSSIIKIEEVAVQDAENNKKSIYSSSESIYILINYKILSPTSGITIKLRLLSSNDSVSIFTSSDALYLDSDFRKQGKYESICIIPPNILNEGQYIVVLFVSIPGIKVILDKQEYVTFNIERLSDSTNQMTKKPSSHEKLIGVINPFIIKWKIQQVQGRCYHDE